MRTALTLTLACAVTAGAATAAAATAAAATAGAAAAAATPAAAAKCSPLAAVLKAAPKFADYEAHAFAGPHVAPRVHASREAWQYRTNLRDAAKAGPNFAGRYTLAGWGCGTGCLDWGVVDQANGKVTFDGRIRTIENLTDVWPINDPVTGHYAALGANAADFDTLLFRKDSDLLVMLGAPGGDEAQSGIHWLRWTGARFESLRFVAAGAICRKD
ncbi:MAG: hypothetical protein JOZ72_15100 [Alphaproteobacteria bacterium]|nr:hypothetical protein [Alphaproteobacteria bacterium]